MGLFKAVFDYKAAQSDELSLKKGDLYHVSEKCQDGWFKGKNLKTGKSGVFPGNHVKEVDAKKSKRKEAVNVSEGNLIDLTDTAVKKIVEPAERESDAERLKKLKAIRDELRQAQQKQLTSQIKTSSSSSERYRCIVPFPASSEYELDLQIGDVVTLVKMREDGWCKGTHHR